MGCFQSIPKRTVASRVGGKPVVAPIPQSDRESPVHEFFEVQNGPADVSEAVQGNSPVREEKYFDPEIVSDLHSDANSPENELLSSAIVELPESVEEASSDVSHRPDSPEFIVSPNPGSPSRFSPPIPGAMSIAVQEVNQLPEAVAINPEEFKSATATPVQTAVVPEPAPVVPAVRSATLPRSRILQVAEGKNKVLILQVFGVWRFEALNSKIEAVRAKLDAAGKASEVILKDNATLKARVAELEHAITVVQSVPMKSQATGTEDLQGFISVPSTPPVKPNMVSGFATPVSNPVSIPASVREFASPDAVRVASTPPQGPVKLSWEDYLRPSVKEQVPPAKQVNAAAPPVSDKKYKLQALSEDLSRLSESLAAVELKHRRPLNSTNK